MEVLDYLLLPLVKIQLYRSVRRLWAVPQQVFTLLTRYK